MSADISMEETVQKVVTLTENTLNSLFTKWEKMYKVNDTFRTHSFETFISHVEELYEYMLASEESKLISLTDAVEMKLAETVQLERDLGTIISRVNTDLPLQSLINDLDNAMAEFKKMKEFKLQHFETLKQQEQELCKFLGKTSKTPIEGFPKEKDFEEFELYLFELTQEKCERITFWEEAVARISELRKQLGLEEESSFTLKILSNEKPKALTEDDIDNIKKTESSLLEQIEVEKKNKTFKLGKLKALWTKLKIPEEEQAQFLNTVKNGFTQAIFSKIDEELTRCETLKLENIKPLIISAREKLQVLWDKVKYDEEQRKAFFPFYSPLYNEHVLELLELQIDKVTAYYENNYEIFELVEKWNDLWERMLHLDELSKDKKRLFNRGGQLLKEEKERKVVENKLPKLFNDLKSALIEYQEKNDSPFLWNGEELLNTVENDWSQRELAFKKKTNSSNR